MDYKNRIVALVVATGIASVTTQLVVIREFLSQFHGNEIVIALVFFNWLILGGLGSRFARHLQRASLWILVLCSSALVLFSVGQIVVTRLLRPELFPLGVSLGFYPVLIFSFLVMAPYATMVGFVLPYSLYTIRNSHPGVSGSDIYVADNLGDVCGGALFSFILIYWCTPVQALLAANLPLIILTAGLVSIRWLKIVGVIVLLAVLGLTVAFEAALLKPPVGKLIDYKESRFGRLTVHQDLEQKTLFADGRPAFSTHTSSLAEEMVHYPFSQTESLESVLMISTVAGMFEEIAKYGPKQVDYIELDAAMVQLLLKYHLIPDIEWVNIIHEDARRWLQGSSQKYDVILLNLFDPQTYQANRFFTDKFFQIASAHLNSQGVFGFSVEGYANYMTETQRDKISSLKNTAMRHFKYVDVLPGQRVFFLCKQSPIDRDIPRRLKDKGIQTRYVGPYYNGNITGERLKALSTNLDPESPLNKDGRPYLMRVMMTHWFAKFASSPAVFVLLLGGVLVVYLVRMKREEFVLFTTGMMTMGSEILLIFAFQIFLGYIYFKIGIMVTIFLAGLLPGAWLGRRLSGRSSGYLPRTDLILILLMSFTIAALKFGGDRLPELFYYGSGFCISMICGFQFPSALAQLGDTNIIASRIFAVDLVGAACGALLVSLVLIPYWGLWVAAYVLIGIKFVSLLVLVSKKGRHHRA